MEFLYGETATVTHRTVGRDQYGNETVTITGTDTVKVAFAPGVSTESWQVGRSPTETVATVYMPPRSFTIGPDDHITIRDLTYEINGTPADWRNPFTGWHPGMELALKRVTG